MKAVSIGFWILISTVVILGSACGGGFDLRYQYDRFGFVESATASKGESVIAIGKRVSMHPENGPTVTDVEIEETHFQPGSKNIIYTGRILFRCETNKEFCDRLSVTPISGKRPRDVFEHWPYAPNQ